MTLINDFLSLIYPIRCEACGNNLYRHERFICNYCLLNLPKGNYHLETENKLMGLFAGRVPVSNIGAFYLFDKSGKVQRLVHAIKYQDQVELARHLGSLFASELMKSSWPNDIDVIIPVPLHKRKLKARGFNQSEAYASGLATGLGKPVDVSNLKRIKDTSTQTKKKKYERWKNVEGIFSAVDPGNLVQKHILIVDDVITTGATIEAVWSAVKDIEGVKISVASIAFAPNS